MHSNLSFGQALEELKTGKRIARYGWNGKGMFLFYVPAWAHVEIKLGHLTNAPFIAIKTADEKIVPWPASQTDVLAEDWLII